METVDNIMDSYVGDKTPNDKDTSVPKAPNQIQRDLEQQISTLQGKPGNATFETNNVAVQAVKVPRESVINRKLVFEAIRRVENNTWHTTVKTGEPPKNVAEAAISFQLPTDIIKNVQHGMYYQWIYLLFTCAVKCSDI